MSATQPTGQGPTPTVSPLLKEKLFDLHLPQSEKAAVSGDIVSHFFAMGDYAGVYRSIVDASFQSLASGADMQVVYQDSGSLGTLGLFIGAARMKGCWDQIDFSEAVGDKRGALIGRVSLIESAALAAGGVAQGIFRPLAITSTVQNVASTSLLARVTNGFGQAASALFSIFTAIVTVALGIKIHEGASLVRQLDKAETLQEKVALLEKKLCINPAKVQGKTTDDELVNEALAAAKQNLSQILKELNIEVSEEKLVASMQNVTSLSKDELIAIGLDLKMKKIAIKKEAKLQRIFDQAGFEAVKDVVSLAGRVRSHETIAQLEATQLIDKIHTSATRQIAENVVAAAIVAICGVAALLSIVLTAGAGLAAASIFGLVSNVLMSGLDAYSLVQNYKAQQLPGVYDKRILLASTLMILSSLAIVAALAASGVVTFGTVPLAITIALSLLWLAHNGVSLGVMVRNERLAELKNPTLETFVANLAREEDDERLKEMWNNLPKELTKLLPNARQQLSDRKLVELKRHVEWLIDREERTKQAGLEALRQAIAPHFVTPAP